MISPGSGIRSGVNQHLTAKPRRRVTENDEYAAFARRVIAAYSRRIAAGDIDAITEMARLADDLDAAIRCAVTGMAQLADELDIAICHAVTGLRTQGYSWADIAARLGVTRQGAQQRWGGDAR